MRRMSDDREHQEEQGTSRRGEAAWKAATERVAARNEQARKAGKQQRQAYERGRDEQRRAAELGRMAALIRKADTR
jgi:hypothetical protein